MAVSWAVFRLGVNWRIGAESCALMSVFDFPGTVAAMECCYALIRGLVTALPDTTWDCLSLRAGMCTNALRGLPINGCHHQRAAQAVCLMMSGLERRLSCNIPDKPSQFSGNGPALRGAHDWDAVMLRSC